MNNNLNCKKSLKESLKEYCEKCSFFFNKHLCCWELSGLLPKDPLFISKNNS